MKILLMANFPGWAFDNIAQGIKKYGTFDYDIKYEVDYRKYRGKELPEEELDFNEYDRIVLFAPWMDWSNLPLDKTICIFHEKFEIDGYGHDKYRLSFVTSDISYNYIKKRENVLKIQAGIDSELFFYEPIKRLDRTERKVIGWVGAYSGHKEKKGYEEFYLPLGNEFTLLPHTKEDNYVEDNYEESLREYFSKIDVLVCTSSWEGYPLVILEASACGVPVVSTRVGIAPEILPKGNICSRNVKSIKSAIYNMDLASVDVSKFYWKVKIQEWENAFLR